MEKKTKKRASTKPAISARVQERKPSVQNRGGVKGSTRAMDAAHSRKTHKRFNKIIPSRLAILIILLLAVTLGAYAFLGSAYDGAGTSIPYFSKKKIAIDGNGGGPAAGAPACTPKKFEGRAVVSAWMLERNSSNKKMIRIAVSRDDMDKIPLKSVIVKEGKYFTANLLDPSIETLSALKGASQANPASIELKAYEDVCTDIPQFKTEPWSAWPTNE